MSYSDRFDRLRKQRAYERAIESRGLEAALEPYVVIELEPEPARVLA